MRKSYRHVNTQALLIIFPAHLFKSDEKGSLGYLSNRPNHKKHNHTRKHIRSDCPVAYRVFHIQHYNVLYVRLNVLLVVFESVEFVDFYDHQDEEDDSCCWQTNSRNPLKSKPCFPWWSFLAVTDCRQVTPRIYASCNWKQESGFFHERPCIWRVRRSLDVIGIV